MRNEPWHQDLLLLGVNYVYTYMYRYNSWVVRFFFNFRLWFMSSLYKKSKFENLDVDYKFRQGWRDAALQLYRFLLPAYIRSWEFRFGPSQQQITRNWKGRISFKKCFTSTDRKKPCPSAKGRVYLIIYICYLQCSSLT